MAEYFENQVQTWVDKTMVVCFKIIFAPMAYEYCLVKHRKQCRKKREKVRGGGREKSGRVNIDLIAIAMH